MNFSFSSRLCVDAAVALSAPAYAPTLALRQLQQPQDSGNTLQQQRLRFYGRSKNFTNGSNSATALAFLQLQQIDDSLCFCTQSQQYNDEWCAPPGYNSRCYVMSHMHFSSYLATWHFQLRQSVASLCLGFSFCLSCVDLQWTHWGRGFAS